MADYTFQLEENSVGDGLRAKLNIPESCKNVHRARNQKVSRFFADLSCDRLISESVKDDSGIRTIMNEAGGRLNPGENALRLILETTPAVIHTGRPDGYLDYFNRGWLVFVGKSSEELCGWSWTDSVHPEDVASLVQKWQAALAGGEPLEAEARVRRSDGEYRLLLHRKVPLRDERGAIVKWFGSSIEKEEQKREEKRIWQTTQDLQRSEFYLQEGERLARMGSWSLKPDGSADYWSPQNYVFWGFDPTNGIPTLTELIDAIHPDDHDFVLKTLARMTHEGVGCDVRYRIIHPERGVRMMLSVGEAVVKDGKLTRFIGNTLDITEQEELTQELHRREACLTRAEALSGTGSFGWNVSTGDFYWSDETFRILEYERTVKPTLELLLKRFHPAEGATVQETIERALKDAKNLEFEHRLLMPNGSIKHVHVLARSFKDQCGNVEFAGAVMDVTATTKAFQEIKALK